MLILALDSTAVVATAALCDGDTVLCQQTISCGKKHSETLLPMIEELYRSSGKTVADTELFACSVGPGSFTGVRIGVATVKGLAFGKKTCVGVSTLEALAYNLKGYEGIISPVMDARRGQIYNALFRWNGEELIRLTPDRIIMIDDLRQELQHMDEPVYFCGDGYSIVVDAIKLPHVQVTDENKIHQNGVSVAQLALKCYSQGVFCYDNELRPIYLRAPQAERERLARMNQSEDKK